MKTSQRGIDLIKQFEGFRSEAYICPAGVWSIGYGTTSGVSRGLTITEQTAEEWLRRDLEKCEAAVMSAAPMANQNQFDALVSFTYNCGPGTLKQLLRYGFAEVADRLPLFCHANGVALPGLKARREAERALFLEAA